MIDRRLYRFCGILLALGLVACGSKQEPANGGGQRQGRPGGAENVAAAAPVKVEPAKRADISQYILKNTALEAEQWVDVRARTTGQVVSILKEEGDPVRDGTVLFRLDDNAARIDVSRAQVTYNEAQQRFERQEALFQRNLGSKEDYSTAKTQLESAKAQLDQAKLTLGYTTIVSPISGVLTIRNIEVGNMVTNNQVVASVANFDPLLARIQVTEKDFGKITVGQDARITVEAAPNREFKGRVRMISPVVDPTSGTVKVTVEVPRTPDDLLRPGMFASVYIITETHHNALVIPKKSLALEGEGNQVFVYEKDPASGLGKAQRKNITIGFSDSDRLEVLSGLAEGDLVITVGQEGLRPGSVVRMVGESAPMVASRDSGPRKTPQNGADPSMRQGGPGGGGGGGSDDERLQRMLSMIQRTPEIKKIYDERVKKDPELGKDMTKLRAFLGEMREKGLIQARGRQGN